MDLLAFILYSFIVAAVVYAISRWPRAAFNQGKPGPPQNVTITSTSETTVRLMWEEPDNDGGCPITEYIIQKCEASKSQYTLVASVEEPECLVENLAVGTAYMFKVAAENEVGTSKYVRVNLPVMTDKVLTPAINETPEQMAEKYKALSVEDIKTYVATGMTNWARLNELGKEKKDKQLAKWILPGNKRQSHLRKQKINLVLLGKTGAGKSATANLIVGDNIFKESASFGSCTRHIQKSEFMVDKVEVNIIDTPGFEDTEITPDEICTEISKVMEEFSEGIDGMLFVFNMGNPRFTKDQEAAFTAMEKGLFGKGVIENCFVILTHIDSKQNIASLSKYLEDDGGTPFGHLLNKKLQRRVIAVNNADKTIYGRNAQKENIIQLILARKGERFSSKQFEEYQRQQLKMAGKLPAHIQFLAPKLQKEISASIQPLGHQQVKELKLEQCAMRSYVVTQIVEKIMGINGVNKDWKQDVRRAVEFTLDNVVDRVIGSAYWKKLGLGLLLFTVPAGVGIASLVAPEYTPFVMIGGSFIMEGLRRERKALE